MTFALIAIFLFLAIWCVINLPHMFFQRWNDNENQKVIDDAVAQVNQRNARLFAEKGNRRSPPTHAATQP